MAARRTNKATGAGEGAGAAISADVASELVGLRRSIDHLGQGLTQLLDATATHTELLHQLLIATTAPAEPEIKLAELLAEIVVRLGDLRAQARATNNLVNSLPQQLASAMGQQLATALAAVR